jgi:hypothetical protein
LRITDYQRERNTSIYYECENTNQLNEKIIEMWENIYQKNKETFKLLNNAEIHYYGDIEKTKEDKQYIKYDRLCECISDMVINLPF